MSFKGTLHLRAPLATFAVGCALALASVIPSTATAQDREYSVERHAQAATSGVVTIRIANGSGHLVVNGRNGANTVSATGIIRGSSQEVVNAVTLDADRSGDVITIRADAPDRNSWGDGWSMDLTVEVPSGMHLDVSDGSGGARLQNVGSLNVRAGSGGVQIDNAGGSVELASGSGGARMRGIRGDVSLRTGSGAIVIDGVTGSVDVRNAGSGSLDITHVTGALHVGSIGSGSLTADAIGGDLTVDRKGSASISYTNVKGHVDVPSRWRDR